MMGTPSTPAAARKMESPAELAAFVNAVLAEGHAYNPEQRRQATSRLMRAFTDYKSNPAFTPHLLTAAVSALKTLGRSAEGTEDLASEQGIGLLLELAHFSPSTGSNDAFLRDPLPLASSEAIRCLANVCLLHEPARLRLARIPGLPGALIKREEQATVPMTRFLAARLLFLSTVCGGDAVITLVEDLKIAKYLSRRMLGSLELLCSGSPAPMENEILSEYLKIAFNVSHFYTREISERNALPSPPADNPASNRTGTGTGKEAISTPLSKSKSTSSSSSTASSIKSVKSRSTSPAENTAGRTSPKNNKSSTMSSSSRSTASGASQCPYLSTPGACKIKDYFSRKGKGPGKASSMYNDDDILRPWGFEEVVSALTQLALCLTFGTDADYGPFAVYKHVVNALLNYSFASYASVIFAPLEPAYAPPIADLPSTSTTRAPPSLPPLVARLLTLLDGCAAYYMPGTTGPDDDAAREAALAAPSVLDESLQVLILLLTKCAVEDPTGDIRRGLKECLLADDIDRTVGLEKRNDLTGRLVRLLNSTYLSGSSEAAGKFLFAICDQDPSNLVAAIGYGNASGFLQSMNMLIPPGATANGSNSSIHGSGNNGRASSASSRRIDPITGAYEQPSSNNETPMTDEEKEREAEKLFVLFDRMNKNGAMSVVNPVKEAQATGKLASTAEEQELERKRLQEEEDEDERQALAEMQRYKERKKPVTQ